MRFQLPPVYPITDKRLSGKTAHWAIVRELVRGGATLIEIRDKETPLGDLLDDLRHCVEVAARHEARIIINDRCDLALLSGAAGVHLGQEDLPPAAARRVLGRGPILGFSTHNQTQVRESNRLPIQYIGFGPVFATASKPNHDPVVGLKKLKRMCRLAEHPVVAIGGIGLEQLRPVFEAGADSAAILSAIMNHENIARRMEQLLIAARGR
jgi:thiamine-phosphate pyrophosphorylase